MWENGNNQIGSFDFSISGDVLDYSVDIPKFRVRLHLPPSQGVESYNLVANSSNCSDQLVWSSSDSSIVSVDSNGVINAQRVGTATITATCPADGSSDSVFVVVYGTPRVTARMSNVDDISSLYINGEELFKAQWGHMGVEPDWYYFGHQPGDSGEIDITPFLVPGENTLRFTLWNEAVCCSASLNIEVKKDGEVIISDSFSISDSSSGIKYDETFIINYGIIDGDTDGDGMPDVWELDHGLNPLDPTDALEDPDVDGLINVDEFKYRTDPNDEDTVGDGGKDLFVGLAKHYSPIIYQHVDVSDAGDGFEGYADLITNFNYDGNWNGNEKWENLEDFISQDTAKASIYYSVIETSNYWFIYYALYHPRDWTNRAGPLGDYFGQHENDMEGITLMVSKGNGYPGDVIALMSMSHNVWLEYVKPGVDGVTSRHYLGDERGNSSGVQFEDEVIFDDPTSTKEIIPDGYHPKVYIQSKGHGIFMDADSDYCLNYGATDPATPQSDPIPSIIDHWDSLGFPGEDGFTGTGVVYYCSYQNDGETVTDINNKIIDSGELDDPPDAYTERWIKYQLLPMSELWNKRFWIAENRSGNDETFATDDGGYEAFYGDGWTFEQNAAHPPWSIPAKRIKEPDTGEPLCPPRGSISIPGEIFFDPLFAFPQHFNGLETLQSEEYSFNPYYTIIVEGGDSDSDGMPDWWEIKYGLNPYVDDADDDLDNDGATNLEEYMHGTNPIVAASVHVRFQEPDVTVSLTGDNRIFFEVTSSYPIPKAVQLSITDIDPDWYTLDDADQNILLMPFGKRKITARLHLPDQCDIAGVHPFSVIAAWMHDSDPASATADSTLIITPNPNIYRLAIPEDTRLAGNNILIAWKTDVPTDGTVFYRQIGEEDFIEVNAGTNSTEHRVTLSDLEFFTHYEYYTESRAACDGLTRTDLAMVKTGKAVKFADGVNEFWVDRDYKQVVQLTITNTDTTTHTFDLSAINGNDDIVVDFVGEGSNGRQATLEAGESVQVELVVHAAEATKTDYDIYLKIVSDLGDFDSFVDYSRAIVHVRPFVANLDLQPVESTPGMMTYRYRLINYGDTLGDIEVFVDDDNMTKTWMVPEVHHYRLANGEFIEFDIHAQEYTTGTVYARSGNYMVSASFEIGCPDGTNLQTYTLTDVPVEAQIKDWYCTNKNLVELPFAIPKGVRYDGVAAASVELNFSLPMSHEKYDPHNLTISLNGNTVATLENTIPEGLYEYRIPIAFLNFGYESAATNYLTLAADGIGAGQYVVATDFRVKLNVNQMEIDLCVPPGPPPRRRILPEPETKIVSVGPDDKYRPGDTVNVNVELYNNDEPGNIHEGTLTVTLENNSNLNGAHPVESVVRVFELNVAPGPQTVTLIYQIPETADDIDYTISATFENRTMGTTSQLLGRKGFYVRTPLVIVHGIMGSELHDAEGNDLWSVGALATPCDNTLDALVFDSTGNPIQDDIRATHVIRKVATVQLFGQDLYTFKDIFYGLEKYLKNQKYKYYPVGRGVDDAQEFDLNNISLSQNEREDVFYFVYDWRNDISSTAYDLETFINNVIASQEYGKVNILAHSMGGLVCKSALHQNSALGEKIDKIIFIGTPNLGAVEAFSVMKHGLKAPKFGQTIYVDYVELTSRALSALTLLKSAQAALDNPISRQALSTIIGLVEIDGNLKDPSFCSDAVEITQAILGAIGLFYGEIQGALATLLDYYNNDKDLDGIRDSQAQKLSATLPSSHQLLPSEIYFSQLPQGYYSFNEVPVDTYAAMYSQLSNWFNEMLLNEAESIHANIDSMPMPESAYAIVGCQKCTTTYLEETDDPFLRLRFIEGDGDGTVPLESALDINIQKKYAAKYAEHSNLPSQPGVRLLLRSLLKGYENNFETSPFYPVDEYANGVCGVPTCSAGGKFIIKFLPLVPFPEFKLTALDGRVTWIRPNGIRIGILGSDYRITNEGVEIYVPEGSIYTLEFKGVDQEYLNVKFPYVFADLTLDIDGCGEVTFDLTDVMTDPVLRLDQQCDGSYEQENIPPTNILDETESNDFIAPVTTATVSGTLGENGWYTSEVKVTLNAIDEGGSGLWQTRHRLSGAENYTEYEYNESNTGPVEFTISDPGEYTLYYYSIDRNLNREIDRILEFKIDNVAPQLLSVTDEGYFSLGTSSLSASLEIQTGISGLQDVSYSVGTSPGSNDVMDWASAGPVSTINLTGLSLVENCAEKYYINVQAVSGSGLASDMLSSDGVIVLEPGGDPDGDGFDNESELAAGSNACNPLSRPGDTTVQLKEGFNVLSIPEEVMFKEDLRDWISALGNSTEIDKVQAYNDQTAKFATLLPGDPPSGSFMLEGGEGLIVYANQDKEVTFTTILCTTYDLKSGFNLIGIACPPAAYTAFQLLTSLGFENVASIQRFSPEKGAFETASFNQDGELVGFDFEIVPGEGYFIFMKQEVLGFEF
jgi:pimeloyl-ACP methyl ester carboxylesterase